MATRIGSFKEDSFVASTRKTVFTAAQDTDACINNINITNTGASAITIDIEAYDPATTKYYLLRDAWSIPPHETRTQDGVIVLEGDAASPGNHEQLVITTDINTLHIWGSYQEVDH